MKNTAKEKNVSIAQYSKSNVIYVLLAVCFAAGIIAGALIFNYALKNDEDILRQFALSLGGKADYLTTFINCSVICFIYFLFITLLGLSLAGRYVLYIVPFIKGLSYGYVSSFVFAVFGTDGILINLLGILPQTVLSAAVIIFACRIAVIFSKGIIQGNSKLKLKHFLLCMVILFLLCIVISLMDVFVTGLIINNCKQV